MKWAKDFLISLGGNTIKQPNKKGIIGEQYKNCYKTTKYIAEIVKDLDEDDRLFNNKLWERGI